MLVPQRQQCEQCAHKCGIVCGGRLNDAGLGKGPYAWGWADDHGWGQAGTGAAAIGARGTAHGAETVRDASLLGDVGEIRWLVGRAVIASMAS